MCSPTFRYVIRAAATIILLIGSPRLSSCCGATSQARIYWSGGTTWRANSDGSDITQIFDHPVEDLFIDSRTNTLYSTSIGGVYRSTLDGENISRIFSIPDQTNSFLGILSLAFDNVRNHIYGVENINSTIYRFDLDGANPKIIIPSDGIASAFIRIEDVRVDSAAEKLYWSYGKKDFYRSNLDGTDIELLFSWHDYLQDFEIDSRNEKIYWTSSNWRREGGSVHRANFDGSDEETLISDGLWGAYGIALDLVRERLYFSDAWTSGPTNYDGTIRVASLDGSMVDTVVNLGPNAAMQPWRGLAVDLQIVPEPRTSVLFAIVTGSFLAIRWRLTTRNAYRHTYNAPAAACATISSHEVCKR
jgi:sugar lactone lactonase YvrE